MEELVVAERPVKIGSAKGVYDGTHRVDDTACEEERNARSTDVIGLVEQGRRRRPADACRDRRGNPPRHADPDERDEARAECGAPDDASEHEEPMAREGCKSDAGPRS